MPPKVAVIGGGISGLACAYRIQELSVQNQFPIELLLFESKPRLGGTIRTLKQNGCLLELGPDAIFTEKSAALEFGKKIGLEFEWIGTNPNFRKSYVYFRKQLFPVPEGFYLLAPSRLLPMLVSPLFSWRGKWRMLLEPFLPSKKSEEDESLGSFVRRRFGKEVLDRIAQPMVGGIYSTDPEVLSLETTFPKFLEWERKYGSVIQGLARLRKSAHYPSQGPRYSLFVTLKEGLSQFIVKIQEKLPKECFQLENKVNQVLVSTENNKKFSILCDKNIQHAVDALCMATPAPVSGKILRGLDPTLSQELSKIEYSSCATINLIYKKEDFKHKLEGFGFVVPASEGNVISGCTFSSVKFPGRSTQDTIVLRAFIGGKQYDRIAPTSDNQIAERVRDELRVILKLETAPLFSMTYRHERALPQYRVGHRKIVEAIQKRARQWKGLVLCGNGTAGTGIPDCIKSAQKAAEEIFASLRS